MFALNKSPYSDFKLPKGAEGCALLAEALKSVATQLPRRDVSTTWREDEQAYQSTVLRGVSELRVPDVVPDTFPGMDLIALDELTVATVRQMLDSVVGLFEGRDPRFSVELVSKKKPGLIPELFDADRNRQIREDVAARMAAGVFDRSDKKLRKNVNIDVVAKWGLAARTVRKIVSEERKRTKG